jgi:hypothetical protein
MGKTLIGFGRVPWLKWAHGLAVYRLLGMQEVEGSIPSGSTTPSLFSLIIL